VIPQNAYLASAHDLVQAFTGIRAVTDDVTQAVDLRNALVANVIEHHAKCFKVGVDVADQCSFQL
jgi:hypothetical protein